MSLRARSISVSFLRTKLKSTHMYLFSFFDLFQTVSFVLLLLFFIFSSLDLISAETLGSPIQFALLLRPIWLFGKWKCVSSIYNNQKKRRPRAHPLSIPLSFSTSMQEGEWDALRKRRHFLSPYFLSAPENTVLMGGGGLYYRKKRERRASLSFFFTKVQHIFFFIYLFFF